MKKRKITLISILICALATSAGCTKNASIYGESTVLENVEKEVPTEKYTFVSKEDASGTPKKCTYYFKSEERDLKFTAVSTLTKQHYVSGDGEYYSPEVIIDYEESVHALYKDEINEALAEINSANNSYSDNKYGDGEISIADKSESERVAETIYKADQIYSQELDYNTEKWLDNHGIKSIKVTYTNPTSGEEKTYYLTINGLHTLEDIQEGIDELWEE